MVTIGQINDFVQILGLKTPISLDTFHDHLTLEGSGTPKLLNVIIPKNLG